MDGAQDILWVRIARLVLFLLKLAPKIQHERQKQCGIMHCPATRPGNRDKFVSTTTVHKSRTHTHHRHLQVMPDRGSPLFDKLVDHKTMVKHGLRKHEEYLYVCDWVSLT